jgi:Protein of unknown function (DUF3429)
MTGIPRSALWLGLAGLIPFVWGVACAYDQTLAGISFLILGPAPRLMGVGLVLSYGVVILSFMSGVLWGFATRATERAGLYYALSVLPALWGVFMVGGPDASRFAYLGAGFVGLLGLDWLFAAQGLAPGWWMRLRVLLTAGVLACLALAAGG